MDNIDHAATAGAAAKIAEFVPGAIWRDNHGRHINAHGGGFLYCGGVYYWFGEHKIEGEAGNRAHVGVHVYASEDLYNWRDEGIALAVVDGPASEIARGCVVERPKVIYNERTKQFVMWFHLELNGMGYRAARVGVAVSERAAGPYRFLRSFRPNAGHWARNVVESERRPLNEEEIALVEKLPVPGGLTPGVRVDLFHRRDFAGGQMSRDMTLFVDDDGSAYHIAASEENSTLHISRLSDDYLDSSGEYVRAFPGRYHEAPAMFKHGGMYYLITSDCTGWAPNAARLSVASSPLGEWRELGNPCVGTSEEIAVTFSSQSTYVLPVAGGKDALIFVADRWQPKNAIDGRYIWLPIEFSQKGLPVIRWRDRWKLSDFDRR